MSSYSSSNLDDDPNPVYTPYNPKRGVAWAPRVVHFYDDLDASSDSDPGGEHGLMADRPRKPHRPLRRRSSALSLSASLSSVFGSLTNLLTTPRPSRKAQSSSGTTANRKPASTASSLESNRPGGVRTMPPSKGPLILKSRSMSDSTLAGASQRRCGAVPNSFHRRNRNSDCESAGRTTTSGRPAPMMAFRSGGSRESLPSVNSDGAKSSVDSPDGSTGMRTCSDAFDEGFGDLSPGSSSGGGSPGRMEVPSFADLGEDRTTLNLRELVREEDVTYLAIDRRYLRTGRLVTNEYNRAVCCGSLRTKSHTYPSRIRAVTIHIHKDMDDRTAQTTLIRDVMSLRHLRHRHVVEMLGLCMEGSPHTPGGTEVLVVTERAHFHLTLRRLALWAGENNSQLLTPQIVSTFGIQICHGLRYLEKNKILHTNLTTATVLLDTRCVCKLHDVHFQSLEDRALNTRWLPLETFLQSLYTFKSVVWSMGVLLWELASMCSEQPYPHLTTLNDIILYLAHGKRLIRPETCPNKLYRIMCHCWCEKPRSRPTLDDLIIMLTSYRQTLPAGKPPEEVFQDRDDFWEDNSWMDDLDGVYDISMM